MLTFYYKTALFKCCRDPRVHCTWSEYRTLHSTPRYVSAPPRKRKHTTIKVSHFITFLKILLKSSHSPLFFTLFFIQCGSLASLLYPCSTKSSLQTPVSVASFPSSVSRTPTDNHSLVLRVASVSPSHILRCGWRGETECVIHTLRHRPAPSLLL